MGRTSRAALLLGGLTLAAAGAWNLYQRATTETVPYAVVDHVGDVELRRYPAVVLVETVAPSENAAFGRLFRYITGANDGGADLSMTTPVQVSGRGRQIAMTAPVETSAGDRASGVRMAFYLPADTGIDAAPAPTDDDVDLVSVPERTLAVRRFSGFASDRRIARERDRLLAALERADVDTTGEPFFLGYDAPWTLPFLRRNEVAVQVDVDED